MLENFLGHKTGRPIRETNISPWRRAICGDLSSVFRPYRGGNAAAPAPLPLKSFLIGIDRAQYRPVPGDFRKLTAEEIRRALEGPPYSPVAALQERGVRPACALPYELGADGTLDRDRKSFVVGFSAGKNVFGERSAGAPFPPTIRGPRRQPRRFETGQTWAFAVSAGDQISYGWDLDRFYAGAYFLRVHGPNGFFREFRGSAGDPQLEIAFDPRRGEFALQNTDPKRGLRVTLEDLAYGGAPRTVDLDGSGGAGGRSVVPWELGPSFGWHEIAVRVEGYPNFVHRYAGHLETPGESFGGPHG